jgi:nucleotide-binding universal stress UspA family protein
LKEIDMKVLIPVDGSDCAQTTMIWASQFLNPAQTEIYLFQAVPVIPLSSEIPMAGYEYDTDLAQAHLKDARVYFESKGFTVSDAKYSVGDPVEAICDYANEAGVDQIVIGSHGRQGIAKFLMGSVSEGVFKHAKQPVVVVNNGHESSLYVSHADKVKLTQSV